MKSLLTICILSLFALGLNAQISEGGKPISDFYITDTNFDEEIMPSLDIARIQAEDDRAEAEGDFHRIGRVIPTDLSPENAGTWEVLPSGDQLWRLKITAQGAKGINVYFKDYDLPKDAKLFIYNEKKSEVLGAFTQNNDPNTSYFATGLIHEESLIVEYFSPRGNEDLPFVIEGVGHAYRNAGRPHGDTRDFGDSQSCQVNTACSEASAWQDQVNSAARILVKDGPFFGWCSGAIVNNTNYDCKPYFLTAFHCGQTASAADFSQWVFNFNYQSATCSNPTNQSGIPNNSITGAVKRMAANNTGSNILADGMLLEFNQSIPSSYNVFYAGWDNTNSTSGNGVSVHHPSGDIKKISTHSNSLQSTSAFSLSGTSQQTHWSVTWSSTASGHGVTEGGSSGSPIFNNNGHIVGVLTGGSSSCNGTSNPDVYGKMYHNWTLMGTTPDRQLKAWLDPNDSGLSELNGVYFPCSNASFDAGIVSILSPSGTACGTVATPVVRLRNYGATTLTSVTINYNADNGGSANSFNWTGSLAQNSEIDVELPSISIPLNNFNITASTSNPNGNTDENTGNDASSAAITSLVGESLNWTENFEDFAQPFPPNGIVLFNPDNDAFEWERRAGASGYGNGVYSAYYNNYDGSNSENPNGTLDWMILPVTNFSTHPYAKLQFDLAYTFYENGGDQFVDSLLILVATDCGNLFDPIWRDGGVTMATAPGSAEAFFPTSGDWRTVEISLDDYAGGSYIQIAFVSKSGWGNNLFIDNVNVLGSSTPTSVGDIEALKGFAVSPNPTQGKVNIFTSFEQQTQYQIEVHNSIGQLLRSSEYDNDSISEDMDMSNWANGVYYFTLRAADEVITRKVVLSK